MFKHILLPTDGSELSDKAARQAVKMAKVLGAKITAIHVMPNYARYVNERYKVLPLLAAPVKRKYQSEANAVATDILEHVYAAAMAAAVECARVSVVSDSPSRAIIKQAAKSNCDVIMMASHGRRGLQGLLLGSETQKVLVHSKIPVLVCR